MHIEPVNIAQYGFSVLQIETMSVCDMLCSFCPYPKRSDKGSRLPDTVVSALIDSLRPDDSFEYIAFSHFNEPLLDDRIFDFIRRARERGLPVMIITNGLAFRTDKVMRKLIDAAPDFIKISLQTLNPELFRRARGINYPFHDYVDGIIDFLAASDGGRSAVNVDIACNFLSGARKLKVFLFGLERGDPSVYNSIDDLKSEARSFFDRMRGRFDGGVEDVRAVEEFFRRARSDYAGQEGLRVRKNITVKIKPFTCGNRLTEFYPVGRSRGCSTRILGILASGSVVPCCMSYGDMLSIGTVTEAPLAAVLEKNTDFLNNIRRGKNLPLTCRRCQGAPTKRGAALRNMKNFMAGGARHQEPKVYTKREVAV